MDFQTESSEDGGITITINFSKEDVSSYSSGGAKLLSFGKTDYCVTCRDNTGGERRYTIECYGDIAANIEAALTCAKEMGNPSYSLNKGKC